VQRNLIFYPNGDIRLIGEPEEVNNSSFNLSDVYQLVWSEGLENMPSLAFTFKDQKKYPTIEIQFEKTKDKDDFLEKAQNYD